MKSFLVLKEVMTTCPDMLRDSGQLKSERFQQVCDEPKFFLMPGYEPAEQLMNALPIPNTSSGLSEHWPVDMTMDAVNDWWRGCEVNVISYVSQLLPSLVAHLSLLAHPVCDIPAGTFPTKSFCFQTYICSFTPPLILFSPFDQNKKWQPALQTSDLLKLGNVCALPAAFSQRWFTLLQFRKTLSLISPTTGTDEPQMKFETVPWAAASVHFHIISRKSGVCEVIWQQFSGS